MANIKEIQDRMRSIQDMAVNVNGKLPADATAKDIILAVIVYWMILRDSLTIKCFKCTSNGKKR